MRHYTMAPVFGGLGILRSGVCASDGSKNFCGGEGDMRKFLFQNVETQINTEHAHPTEPVRCSPFP